MPSHPGSVDAKKNVKRKKGLKKAASAPAAKASARLATRKRVLTNLLGK